MKTLCKITFLLIVSSWATLAQDGSDMRYVKPNDLSRSDIGKWVHLDFGKRSFALHGVQRPVDTQSLENMAGGKIDFVEHRVDDGYNNWFEDQYLESIESIDGLKLRWTKNKLLEIGPEDLTVEANFDYITPTGNPVLGKSYSKNLSFSKSSIAEVLIYNGRIEPLATDLAAGPSASMGFFTIEFWDPTCKRTVTGVSISGTGPTMIKKQMSDGNGEITFSNLRPGTYSFTAEKKGFVRFELTDVSIVAGMRRREAVQFGHTRVYDGVESQSDSNPCDQSR
jgi:hypothetical protein